MVNADISPVELNRYNKNIPDICTKCTETKGTLFHCIWQCRKIKTFWEEVRVRTEMITSEQILLDPKIFLLGLYPEKHNYSKNEQAFIDLSLLNAKKCIALLWKKIHRPSATQWIRQMLSSLPLERITYILKAKQHIFENIWRPFMNYVNDLDLTGDQVIQVSFCGQCSFRACRINFFLLNTYILHLLQLIYSILFRLPFVKTGGAFLSFFCCCFLFCYVPMQKCYVVS